MRCHIQAFLMTAYYDCRQKKYPRGWIFQHWLWYDPGVNSSQSQFWKWGDEQGIKLQLQKQWWERHLYTVIAQEIKW